MDYVKLSKAVAHALRHEPESYGLNLDGEGWTAVEALVEALRSRSPRWRELTPGDIERMIGCSSKRRFELEAGRIRALYGHSLPERVPLEPEEPPEVLYHGTFPWAAEAILRDGLKPMRRQYVHLSLDVETALEVGRRRTRTPVVLLVHAAEAHEAGIGFYHGGEAVWLSDPIPARFLRRLETP